MTADFHDRLAKLRDIQSALATTEREAFLREAGATLFTGLKLKRVMQRRGLRRARAKCPRCGNETLQGALAGRRDHLRMWCDTEGCGMGMIE